MNILSKKANDDSFFTSERQKDSEICLTTISLLFFAFLGLFKLFFDYFDKILILRHKNGVIRLLKFLKTPFDFFDN